MSRSCTTSRLRGVDYGMLSVTEAEFVFLLPILSTERLQIVVDLPVFLMLLPSTIAENSRESGPRLLWTSTLQVSERRHAHNDALCCVKRSQSLQMQ